MYLPVDRVVPVERRIDPVEQTVLPSVVVERFIERSGFRWLMNKCICRDTSSCSDFPIDMGCLFLGEAARDINPALGRPVTVEEALDHARRCREAGLVHLIGRNKLDTVWLGVGPGDRLLTLCHCCPCCCLWRMLPQLNDRIGAVVTRMPGVEVAVSEWCIGCGACQEDVCFVDAIGEQDGRALISDRCRGCGLCVEVCPEDAIELRLLDESFVEATEARVKPLVNVD